MAGTSLLYSEIPAGVCMLCGAFRERLSTFTHRSANGPVTLPSISFYEE
ncbi:MAG: hypothetical protein JJU05_05010 [Verrucomicrobia bacterium]|nr:hypothetical protein [Verrucomicrobiota bacterium]MCH8526792.1 hypothetical protein [Kiritimatiellia bacterium]